MQLNHLERPDGMGTLSKILFNQNMKEPMPSNNNEKVDIQEHNEKKLQKAEELANQKGRYNCKIFASGDKVFI